VEIASDTTPSRSSGERRWWWVAGVAAVVTVACGAFAVGAAVTSDDDGSGTASSSRCGETEALEAVRIAQFAFDPAQLTVPVGSTIEWTNEDGVPHNLRSGDGDMSSPDLATGDCFSETFEEPGTFGYFCGIHSSMVGTVTVTE
jgi:plastocyanin